MGFAVDHQGTDDAKYARAIMRGLVELRPHVTIHVNDVNSPELTWVTGWVSEVVDDIYVTLADREDPDSTTSWVKVTASSMVHIVIHGEDG